MKVVVCIKQVSHIYHPLAIDAAGSQLDTEKMVLMLNPYDEIALEQAVRIKECCGDCEIIAITLGLPSTEKVLRYACAMGADRMIRIDYDANDPWLTAQLLACAIKDLKYDIVLCGRKAIDNNAGQVGSFLGELLQLPQVSGIVGLRLFPEKKMAIAVRYLGRGDGQAVESSLPALFTVEEALNDPRYPTLGNRLLAEKKKVEVIKINPHELHYCSQMCLTESVRFSPPSPKPKKAFNPDSNLTANERMKLIMSGGVKEEKCEMLKGKTDDVVERIMEVLVQENIL